MAEKLVLDAELRDGISKKLREIQKELGAFNETPGMKQTSTWMAKFTKEAEGFAAKGIGVGSILSGIGLGSLTAAASIGTLAEKMREAGQHALGIKEVGRQIGMTADELNRFAHAGEHFGITQETMKDIARGFASTMPEFKRATGELFKELSGIPGFLDNIYGRMKTEDLGNAMIDGLRVADKVFKSKGGPQQAKKLLEQMFPGHGDDALKMIGDGKLDELLGQIEKMRKDLNPINPELLKQSQAWRDAMSAFNVSIENFENKFGPAFLKQITDITNGITDFFTTLTKKDGEKTKGGSDTTKDHLDHRTWGQVFGDALNDTMKLLDGDLSDHPTAAEKPKAQPQSYEGQGGLLHKTAFVMGGGGAATGSNSLEAIISGGTKSGVLAAFREMMALNDAGQQAMPVSYGPSGGGGLGRGFGGGIGRALGGRGGPGSLAGANLSGGDATGEHADYIRKIAKQLGIDPRVAVAVAKSEGLGAGFGVGDHGTSFGDYQLHLGGLADIYKRQGGIIDPKHWREMDEFALKYAAKNGWGSWHGAKRLGIFGMAGIGGHPVGAGVRLPSMAGGKSYPGHITGMLDVGGEKVRFGSGGVHGASSIPFGDYAISPDAVGPWGRAHGALGLNGGKPIWDATLGRYRSGIEIHAGHSANLITEGCLAVGEAVFGKISKRIKEMASHGGAMLHIDKNGARIISRTANAFKSHPDVPVTLPRTTSTVSLKPICSCIRTEPSNTVTSSSMVERWSASCISIAGMR